MTEISENPTVSDLTQKSKDTLGTIGGAVAGATSVIKNLSVNLCFSQHTKKQKPY